MARRFSVVGLTMHGPFFFHGYRWLDTFASGPPSLKGVRLECVGGGEGGCQQPGCRDELNVYTSQALLKTCIGQLTLFPVYLTSALVALQVCDRLHPAPQTLSL